MADPDKSGHWSSLAAGLGATPPADDEVESTDAGEPEAVEPAGQADIEEPIVEHLRPSTVPLQAPPTDWSKLAGDLGIEIPEQAYEPTFEPTSEPASVQIDTSPPTVDVDEPPLPTEEVSDQAPLLEESDDWGQVAEEDEDNELAELALDARDDGGFASGIFDDSLDVEIDDEEADFIADIAEADGLETGVDPADSDEPSAEKKPGRRRRRRRPRGRKSSDDVTDTPPELAADEQSDDAVTIADGESEDTLEISLVADETESASSDSEEPPTKTKRRRRRRRGSGRKTTPTSEDDQPSEEESPESDDEPKVLSDDKPRRRSRRKASPDVKSEDGQEDEGSGKAPRDSHRAIPSWAEAIDVVISANVENHKKSSPGGPSRSRGGRKRGGREKSSDKAK